MNQNKTYIWCCDFAINRGEGILANLYLKKISKYLNTKEIIIENLVDKEITTKNNLKKIFINKKNINHTFLYKYFSPIMGIIKIWIKYIREHNVAYINFLPLWNFFLWSFLPKKTILGPVTGDIYIKKISSVDSFFRKYLLNFFCHISVIFIKKKFKSLIFSTDLLKNFIDKKIGKNKFVYNFQLTELKKLSKIKIKKIDIIFYNRNHSNKENEKIIKLLRTLKSDFDVRIVGDFLYGFKNYGIISRNKLNKILSKTKIVIGTSENVYSFFIIDAISNNCFINLDVNKKKNVKYFKKNFVFSNLNNLKKTKIIFKAFLKKNKTHHLKDINKSFLKINRINRKIDSIIKKNISQLKSI